MKKVTLVFIFLAFTAIGSCQSKEVETTKAVTTEKIASGKSTETLAKVSLNNGQLWQANPETTTGINALRKILLESKQEENASVLKEKLKSEFSLIFKKCTMTGEAHNQLHNYLYPLKLKINSLEEMNKADLRKEIVAYLEEYSLFFI